MLTFIKYLFFNLKIHPFHYHIILIYFISLHNSKSFLVILLLSKIFFIYIIVYNQIFLTILKFIMKLKLLTNQIKCYFQLHLFIFINNLLNYFL